MTKDYGKSIHDRLLNISRKEQLSFQMILSRYIQERFLYRVSVSEYGNNDFCSWQLLSNRILIQGSGWRISLPQKIYASDSILI